MEQAKLITVYPVTLYAMYNPDGSRFGVLMTNETSALYRASHEDAKAFVKPITVYKRTDADGFFKMDDISSVVSDFKIDGEAAAKNIISKLSEYELMLIRKYQNIK